jgi:hypothetical protein
MAHDAIGNSFSLRITPLSEGGRGVKFLRHALARLAPQAPLPISLSGAETKSWSCIMAPIDLTLDEILADPIVRRLMERDGVDEAEVRGLSDYVRRRRGPQISPRDHDRLAEETHSFMR